MSDFVLLREAAQILAGLPLGMTHHDYAVEAAMLLHGRPETGPIAAAARRIQIVIKNLDPACGLRQLSPDEQDTLVRAGAVAAQRARWPASGPPGGR